MSQHSTTSPCRNSLGLNDGAPWRSTKKASEQVVSERELGRAHVWRVVLRRGPRKSSKFILVYTTFTLRIKCVGVCLATPSTHSTNDWPLSDLHSVGVCLSTTSTHWVEWFPRPLHTLIACLFHFRFSAAQYLAWFLISFIVALLAHTPSHHSMEKNIDILCFRQRIGNFAVFPNPEEGVLCYCDQGNNSEEYHCYS